MTWGEFKRFIDDELKKAGLDDDVDVDYIDITGPCNDHPMCIPDVTVEDGFGLQVW